MLQHIGAWLGEAFLFLIAIALQMLPLVVSVFGSAFAAGAVVVFTGGGWTIGAVVFVALNLFLGICVFPSVRPHLDAAAEVLARPAAKWDRHTQPD